jgi:hypothetical protein
MLCDATLANCTKQRPEHSDRDKAPYTSLSNCDWINLTSKIVLRYMSIPALYRGAILDGAAMRQGFTRKNQRPRCSFHRIYA